MYLVGHSGSLAPRLSYVRTCSSGEPGYKAMILEVCTENSQQPAVTVILYYSQLGQLDYLNLTSHWPKLAGSMSVHLPCSPSSGLVLTPSELLMQLLPEWAREGSQHAVSGSTQRGEGGEGGRPWQMACQQHFVFPIICSKDWDTHVQCYRSRQ